MKIVAISYHLFLCLHPWNPYIENETNFMTEIRWKQWNKAQSPAAARRRINSMQTTWVKVYAVWMVEVVRSPKVIRAIQTIRWIKYSFNSLIEYSFTVIQLEIACLCYSVMRRCMLCIVFMHTCWRCASTYRHCNKINITAMQCTDLFFHYFFLPCFFSLSLSSYPCLFLFPLSIQIFNFTICFCFVFTCALLLLSLFHCYSCQSAWWLLFFCAYRANCHRRHTNKKCFDQYLE